MNGVLSFLIMPGRRTSTRSPFLYSCSTRAAFSRSLLWLIRVCFLSAMRCQSGMYSRAMNISLPYTSCAGVACVVQRHQEVGATTQFCLADSAMGTSAKCLLQTPCTTGGSPQGYLLQRHEPCTRRRGCLRLQGQSKESRCGV